MTPNIGVFITRGTPEGSRRSIASMFIVVEAPCVYVCLLAVETSCVPIYQNAVRSLGEEQFAEMLAILCCHCNARSLVI